MKLDDIREKADAERILACICEDSTCDACKQSEVLNALVDVAEAASVHVQKDGSLQQFVLTGADLKASLNRLEALP